MTLSHLIALFGAMVVLAALPSMSVLAVVSRAIASGFAHGALTALGIVTGDLLFILFAISGLSLLVGTLGTLFAFIKVASGLYLIGLGFHLWRHQPHLPFAPLQPDQPQQTPSPMASFLSGLLLTLGDQKAVLFYVSFLPTFVDLATLSPVDVGLIMATATVSVGSVKLAYAKLASQSIRYGNSIFNATEAQKTTVSKILNRMAGTILLISGFYLLFKP